MLTEAGKEEMVRIVKQECSSLDRYKEKAGQEGR